MTGWASRRSWIQASASLSSRARCRGHVEQMAKIYGVPPENALGKLPPRWQDSTNSRRSQGSRTRDICYVGDEMIDLGIMKRVFFSVAPADGSPEARAIADFVTAGRRRKGSGEGARPVHPEGPGKVGAIRGTIQDDQHGGNQWHTNTTRTTEPTSMRF